MKRLLILGGTEEAAELAEQALARFAGRLQVTTSLAGRTRHPRPLPGHVISGGFGGVDGLVRHLRDEAVDMLVVATHPFAPRIAANAHRACDRAGLPRLILRRPAWTALPGDNWIEAADVLDARTKLQEIGKKAFLALGSQELPAFRRLRGVPLVLRVAEPPAQPPLPGCEVIVGRGPFDEGEELQLFRSRKIAVLVCRNSGGEATYAKIAAARKLSLPVIMIARPRPEAGETVESVEAALRWIEGRLDA